MKKIALLAGVSFIALTGGAFAADLIVSEPAPAVMSASGHDWTGLYVGASAGYASGTVDWTGDYLDINDNVLGSSSGSFDASGWLLGVQAGANFQADSLVFGIEGDIDWADISGSGAASPTSDIETQLDWLASLRGRIGVSMDNLLLYGTAGLAVGSGSYTITDLDFAGDDRTVDLNAVGWTAGVGAEVALDDNWSLKAEYRYTSLTADEVSFGNVLPNNSLSANGTTDFHLFKVGLNYKF